MYPAGSLQCRGTEAVDASSGGRQIEVGSGRAVCGNVGFQLGLSVIALGQLILFLRLVDHARIGVFALRLGAVQR